MLGPLGWNISGNSKGGREHDLDLCFSMYWLPTDGQKWAAVCAKNC